MAFPPGLIEGEGRDPRENLKVYPGGGDADPHKGGGSQGDGDGNEDNHYTIRLKRVQDEVYMGRHGHVWAGNPNPDSHVKAGRSFNS